MVRFVLVARKTQSHITIANMSKVKMHMFSRSNEEVGLNRTEVFQKSEIRTFIYRSFLSIGKSEN